MMVDREKNLYTRQIEDLEEQVEYWRQRAEAAEVALRGGSSEPGRWREIVPPLTLYQTRIMRLLARRPMTSTGLCMALTNDYPGTSDGSVKVHLSRIRRMVPGIIAPILGTPYRGTFHNHDVPDREALKAFLETGVLPREQMRVAA